MSSLESTSNAVADDFASALSERQQFTECGSDTESCDSALNGWCQICGKNIRHLNPQRQAQHINRCMDQV